MRSKYVRLILATQHLRTIHWFPRKTKIFIGKMVEQRVMCSFLWIECYYIKHGTTPIYNSRMYVIYHIRLGFFLSAVALKKYAQQYYVSFILCVWCHFIIYLDTQAIQTCIHGRSQCWCCFAHTHTHSHKYMDTYIHTYICKVCFVVRSPNIDSYSTEV